MASLLLIASHCVARGPYFGMECDRTSKFEDLFGCDRSVGKEESLFTFRTRRTQYRLSFVLIGLVARLPPQTS